MSPACTVGEEDPPATGIPGAFVVPGPPVLVGVVLEVTVIVVPGAAAVTFVCTAVVSSVTVTVVALAEIAAAVLLAETGTVTV